MSKDEKIIVLGLGNILMSDEGVGVRVVDRLKEMYTFPANVEVYDGGTTGMHGLLPLMEEADHMIVIDAVNAPGEAGDVYRYNLEDFKLTIPKKLSAHDIGFIECLAVAEINETLPRSVTVIGVKPSDMTTMSMDLTETVSARIDDLMDMTVAELRSLGASPILS
ncbi:MAG: HyaD/HybD family hydrogenase maturation endopeptidase [Nitrospinota bacterium]|nr:HyaD/HybD family hydrogenase maturation endopeptidase [Nitrospinota bacterium]